MRSIVDGSPVPDRDLTTRARIRDSAIVVFGEQGFSAGVRAIAAAAGVSPGLVNHHFGSKEGLRAECDAQVLEIIMVAKRRTLKAPSPAGMIAALSEVEQYAPLVAYIVRSFQAGGTLAESLFEHMVEDVEQYLEEGVTAGTLKPSRKPRARARYLTLNSVGSMLLYLRMRADREGSVDYGKAIRDLSNEVTFPALELYTEGMLTDSSMLAALINAETGTTSTKN